METNNRKLPQQKKSMLAALEKSLGVVTTAAKSCGIDRNLHYDWLKDDPEYKAAVLALNNVTLDFAESKLHALINEGNPTATIFFLKTKGKERGYVETTEVTIPAIELLLQKLNNTDIV